MAQLTIDAKAVDMAYVLASETSPETDKRMARLALAMSLLSTSDPDGQCPNTARSAFGAVLELERLANKVTQEEYAKHVSEDFWYDEDHEEAAPEAPEQQQEPAKDEKPKKEEKQPEQPKQ